MKKSEFGEIKKLSIKELSEKVKALRNEVTNLYLEKNTGKLSNLKVIANKRKELLKF